MLAQVTQSTRVFDVAESTRLATMTLSKRIVEVDMSVAGAVRLEDVMCASTLDTRGLDLYPTLNPISDTVASISSVLVKRVDGQRIATGDLQITPPGSAVPFISANAAGVLAMVVNWWQGVGTFAQISTDGNSVDYEIQVSFTTTLGRHLVYTALQLVSQNVG